MVTTPSVNGHTPHAVLRDDLPPRPKRYAHIVGWGMAVPERAMPNSALEAIADTSDEWIRSRTGIQQRYIANERETTSSLALMAAQRALDVADMLPEEVDLVIVATSTPDHVFPSTASLVQAALGANRAGAFDLSAACSGFVYALEMATQSIRSGSIDAAIVIGAETMSRVMDWQDRGTMILFGDGAGAVVLRASDQPGGVLSAVLRSDGAGHDLLGIPGLGALDGLDGAEPAHKPHKLYMNGQEVFRFATRIVGESITQALDLAEVSLADVKLIVPHQANERILQAAARNLKVSPDLFMSNVSRYGNTSAASIPIALCEAVAQKRLAAEDHIVFVGFGGGLSWAASVVQWGSPTRSSRARFNAQRRRISYVVAMWRAMLARWRRRTTEQLRRVRPQRGRMSRLRRKVDRLFTDQ